METPLETERIPRVRFSWLQEQAERWTNAGIIDEATRSRILAGYEAESPQRRGMLALVLLAALMVGIGILLVIGYNWDRLGPYTKVAMTMTGVAAFFCGSAVASARRHRLAAETLALIGTFAFANSIWLIAQVLHIQGHFPDGFMWSAVGALGAAAVLRSSWVGIEAAIFALAWVAAAGIDPPHGAPIAFLAFMAAAVAIAYRLRSPAMLQIAAFAGALWVLVIDPDHLDRAVQFGAMPLTGCAFYAAGAWHRGDVVMRRAWQAVGLVVLLAAFIVLLVADFHRGVRDGHWLTLAGTTAIVAAMSTATLAALRARTAAGTVVLAAGAAVAIWMVLVTSGLRQPPYLWVAVFSALALMLSTALIYTALRTDDVPALSFGILFGLAFILVRWASVIENMLWSGLMLVAAGGGLLVVARLWKERHRQFAIAGRAS